MFGRYLGSIFLMSFTAIGGGVLALPTNTFRGGFFPTTSMLLLTWVFMMLAAFYILEIVLNSREDSDLLTMAEDNLGKIGKYGMMAAYLALLYALICAYIKGTSGWLQLFFWNYLAYKLPVLQSYLVVVMIFGIVIFYSTKATDYLNRVFVLVALVAYCTVIAMGAPQVEYTRLLHQDWPQIFPILPLLITTLGFAIIVPTVAKYLNYNTKYLSSAIFWGSFLPLVCYIVWEGIALGVIPMSGPNGLVELAARDADSTEVALALEQVAAYKGISNFAKCFSLFAIMTSLLGVGLSLYHFLKDGLKTSHRLPSKILLFLTVFLPPMLILLYYPTGFDRILSFGSVFVAIVLGLFPIVLVWRKRYYYFDNSTFTVWGGKPLLLLATLFFLLIIGQELIDVEPFLNIMRL